MRGEIIRILQKGGGGGNQVTFIVTQPKSYDPSPPPSSLAVNNDLCLKQHETVTQQGHIFALNGGYRFSIFFHR